MDLPFCHLFRRRCAPGEALSAADFTLMERFWSSVDRSPTCWVWAGAAFGSGYGSISIDGSSELAHRVAWILAHGQIPDGLWVLHVCDNPLCVRPSHLFLGTPADNMADKVAKGRQARGASVGAKLTAVDVMNIRRRHAAGGVTQASLSAEYGVYVGHLITGRTWKHLPMVAP